MKKLILVLFLILSVSGICVAENTAALDPGGYKDARWGMTKEEVKQAIPNMKWGDGWSLVANAYEDTILEHKATVLFDFDKDKKLIRASVAVMTKNISDNFFNLETDDVNLFNSILKVLREKYGDATSEYRKVSESGISECNWMFPTTQITLKSSIARSGEFSKVCAVSIIYFQRSIQEGNQEDKDKL